MNDQPLITYFAVIGLTTRDLQGLGDAERKFLLASSFIMNDLRFHWHLMIRSPIDEANEYVRAMQFCRWLWCSRKLAAIIYEADNALGKFIPILPAARSTSDESPRISKENRKSKFKAIAETLRNKSAYHYEFEALGSNLSDFADNALHRYYGHEQSGNSISELGEQIFTLPLIVDTTTNNDTREFDVWLKACSGSLMKFCEIVTAKVLREAFPEKVYQFQQFAVANEGKPKDHRWPLFLVPDGNQK